MRFEDKSVIVTGAASGIGRAVAQRLAAEGARVVIADRNLEGLEETRALIGSKATIVPVDVSDPNSCNELVQKTVDANGGLDVLCNIAGVLDFGRVADVTPERWSRVISINLDGVFFLTRAAMPYLIERRGAVVNMASTSGLSGVPYNSAYTASKHGVVGLTKALAIEFGKEGVRVNAVCPGGVETPLIAHSYPEDLDTDWFSHLGPVLDSGGLSKPEDIADAVAFLASSEASRITGVALPVDGGSLAI